MHLNKPSKHKATIIQYIHYWVANLIILSTAIIFIVTMFNAPNSFNDTSRTKDFFIVLLSGVMLGVNWFLTWSLLTPVFSWFKSLVIKRFKKDGE